MDKLISKFKNFDKKVKELELLFCAVAILFITALVTFAIITKNIFNFSFTWTEELCQYIMVWVASIGAVISVEKNEHVGVDIIFNIIPKKFHPYYRIFLALVSAAFLIVFTFFSYLQVVTIMATKRTSVTMPWFQMWWMYLATLVSCGLMGIEYFKTIFVLWKQGKSGKIETKDDLSIDELDKLETM